MLIQSVLFFLSSMKFSGFVADAATQSIEQDLLRYLFKDYKKGARPITHPSHEIEVTFGFELKQVISVDEHEEAIISKLWVKQSWVNALLEWNPDDWRGINETLVDANLLWVPDVVLYNNADNAFNGGTEKYNSRVKLYPNGTNIWQAPAVFKSTCDISVKYFPFDQQTCLLTFGSWAFKRTKLRLNAQKEGIITSEYVVSSEWDLFRTSKEMNKGHYKNSDYDVITYEIVLTRRPLYYVFNVLFPCFILVITILFSFFLPPESGERISLIMTLLLTFSVFLHTINETLPPSSDNIPMLGIFCIIMMVEIGFSLITTTGILILNAKANRIDTSNVPTWVHIIFIGIIARILRINRPVETKKGFSKMYLYDGSEDEKRSLEKRNAEKSMQLMVKRCVNMANKTEEMNKDFSFESISDQIALSELLNELRTINSVVKNKNYLETNQNEWKYLCQIADRLIFYIFFLTIVSSAFMILVPVYMIHN